TGRTSGQLLADDARAGHGREVGRVLRETSLRVAVAAVDDETRTEQQRDEGEGEEGQDLSAFRSRRRVVHRTGSKFGDSADERIGVTGGVMRWQACHDRRIGSIMRRERARDRGTFLPPPCVGAVALSEGGGSGSPTDRPGPARAITIARASRP